MADRVGRIWCLLAVEPVSGMEGIVFSPALAKQSAGEPVNVAFSLIGPDPLRRVAQTMADKLGLPVRLVELSARTDLDLFEPEPAKSPLAATADQKSN